jgi:hypothetical protein
MAGWRLAAWVPLQVCTWTPVSPAVVEGLPAWLTGLLVAVVVAVALAVVLWALGPTAAWLLQTLQLDICGAWYPD